MRILENIVKGLLVLISLFCVYSSPAAFTPIVFLSIALMPVAGLLGASGRIYIALVILGLSTIAISVSPISDTFFFNMNFILYLLVPTSLGIGGIAFGVRRLKQNVPTT